MATREFNSSDIGETKGSKLTESIAKEGISI